MTSRELREKYLKFFEKLGHKIIDPAPLVLEDDPTTLFTSAGMQPLVPYLKGQVHPEGKKLVDSQPCFRSQDIDEVGDNRHTTFFEMLGNWSLGDYFKEEQLTYFWKFLTEELELPKEKLYVSIFEGGDGVDRDTESEEIWKSLGVEESHIHAYPARKNWWSLSGTPSQMRTGDVGGPDSEVFYDFGTPHDSAFGEECHPNCDCGRFLEIGNSVFIQYIKKEDGTLEELPQRNVDFGGGLERLVAAVNNDPDIFNIDLLRPLIDALTKFSDLTYGNDKETDKALRIISDHIRASAFLIKAGVVPSNKLAGYILRKLIRRAAIKLRKVAPSVDLTLISNLTAMLVRTYEGSGYFDYKVGVGDQAPISNVVFEELNKFERSLEKGLKEVQKVEIVDGKIAFDLYQSYGFPLELTEELFREKGQEIDHEQFEEEFEKHRELSRTASAGMFKGGLSGDTPTTRKYHTTAHLLQASLRKVLGDHVEQAGQNITDERLRFDFKHTQALTEEEKKQVEEMINEKITEDLPVVSKIMPKDEAEKSGALAFFKEKYGDQVSVYTIGDDNNFFSREFCGGPHVTHTGEIGRVTITKEESAGSGVRRIYAKID